jgi:hypothetical protein
LLLRRRVTRILCSIGNAVDQQLVGTDPRAAGRVGPQPARATRREGEDTASFDRRAAEGLRDLVADGTRVGEDKAELSP